MTSLQGRPRLMALAHFASAAVILAAACEPSLSDGTGPPPPRAMFVEHFETATTVADLFPATGTRWHGLQIQPDLNEIEVTTERSRTGAQSLRFAAMPRVGPYAASKADIYLDGLHLRQGDAAWFEWWVWLDAWEATEDLFLWDLEAPTTCTDSVSCPASGAGTICSSPGRRVFIGGADERLLSSDLGKWCIGDIMRQIPERAVPFPLASWVRLRVHVVVSSQPTGRLEVWQNDVKVIDATGMTLPREDAVYTRMQIGITQNDSDLVANAIFVDDISVWLEDPAW